MTHVSRDPTQGALRSSDGRDLPLEHTRVGAKISGPVATVTVEQIFVNDSEGPIEAVYCFPLPASASVFEMEFRLEERVVKGVVKERAQARREYEAARSQGKAATILEEETPELFTLSVANVAPGLRIEVELVYQQVLSFDDGQWRFVFPLVAPAQYSEAAAPPAGGPLPPPRMPTGQRAGDVSIEVALENEAGIEALSCHSHQVHTRAESGQRATVTLAEGGAISNTDFVLTWLAADMGVRPRVYVEREKVDEGTFLLMLTPSSKDSEDPSTQGELKALRCGNCGAALTDLEEIKEIPGLGPIFPCGYCGAMLSPGTQTNARATAPRDVLILVDRSASMRGAGGQARRAVRALLGGLPAADAALVVAFDHERIAFGGSAERFVSISPEFIARVDSFLGEQAPRGGSELEAALALSAKISSRDGRARAVVLITDGAVGNHGRLLRRLPELVGASARLYVLGVGASVDRRLLGRLARAGGGACDVLVGDDGEALDRFVRRVRQCGPILTGLSLWWEGAETRDHFPASIPDLYGGQSVEVLGRFGGKGPTRLVITGSMADARPFRQELTVDLPSCSEQTPGLTRLWARQQTGALVESGAPEDRDEALALCLEHAIVGPLTSMVAQDRKVSVKLQSHLRGSLIVMKGKDKGRRFGLAEGRFTMGRHPDCSFRMRDKNASRMHAEITHTPRGWRLRDLDSTNGTRSGGRAIRETLLEDGAILKVGTTLMRFEVTDETFTALPTARVDLPMPGAGPRRLDTGAFAAIDSAPEAEAPDGMRGVGLSGASHAVPPRPAASHSPPAAESYSPPAAALSPVHVKPPTGPGLGGGRPGAGAPPPAAPPSPVAEPSPEVSAGPWGPPPPSPPSMRPPPVFASAQPVRRRAVPQTPIEAAGSDPYPERELRWLHQKGRGELDLLFLVDATGSMGPYIEEVRTRLLELVAALEASALCRSLRLGLVSYRDHPPQEASYITQKTPLTDNLSAVRDDVMALAAQGGGDGPEAVTAGLFDAVRMNWRAGAAKAVVWFGDAPPHGVEAHGDSFPAGCPTGNHWHTQAESCREMGVAIYAIGCLPALRSYIGAEAVYRQVARTTGGMFLLLRESHLLVPLIASAAMTELDKQRVEEHVAAMVAGWEGPLAQTDELERVRWLTRALNEKGVRPRQMVSETDGEAGAPGPLRFRELQPDDVASALRRLRLSGRISI